MQLDHVALQVLLLHELLGAGGALQDRSRSPVTVEAANTTGSRVTPGLLGREPRGRAQPKMLLDQV